MKKKLIVCALSGLLILGGAIAVGASKNDTQVEDSIHKDDKKVEIETEHVQTLIKVKADDSTTSSAPMKLISKEKAAEIAVSEVDGKVIKIEQEVEHGRMEFKVELTTSTGEAKVRIDAETGKVVGVEHDDNKNSTTRDDTNSDDGAHKNRNSGDDDTKTDDGDHQNRNSGDDDTKADDGDHQDKHITDDDKKADEDK